MQGRVGTEFNPNAMDPRESVTLGYSAGGTSSPTRTQRLQNVVLFLRDAVSRNESAVEALYGESNPQATSDEKRALSNPLRDIDLAIEEIESLANRIDHTTGRINEAFFYEGD